MFQSEKKSIWKFYITKTNRIGLYPNEELTIRQVYDSKTEYLFKIVGMSHKYDIESFIQKQNNEIEIWSLHMRLPSIFKCVELVWMHA